MRARLGALLAPALLAACAGGHGPVCAPGYAWVDPVSLKPVATPLAHDHPVILLGEHHDRAADHAWQLTTIDTLAWHEPVVLGLEMFPRATQPVLDRWTAGELDEAAFLRETDWQHVWGFDPDLYWPIFRWARDHRVPMVALNVSSALVHRVAQAGWAAVPAAAREGVGTPAPPSAEYRAMLREAMGDHAGAALDRFIAAQQVWDRAMAEAIVAARTRFPQRTVVGLMGAGHLEHRWGVPAQLAALGVRDALVLIPEQHLCQPPGAGYADAVWVEPDT